MGVLTQPVTPAEAEQLAVLSTTKHWGAAVGIKSLQVRHPPAPSGLDLLLKRPEGLKFAPMLQVHRVLDTPLGCDEGAVHVVNDVSLQPGQLS